MLRIAGAVVLAAVACGEAIGAAIGATDSPGPRFEITVPASAHAGPITGRVYVMIARDGRTEPRLQVGRTGVPFFGRDVEKLATGQVAVIDASDLGSPIATLRDLPA